jgi:hypothetical protein
MSLKIGLAKFEEEMNAAFKRAGDVGRSEAAYGATASDVSNIVIKNLAKDMTVAIYNFLLKADVSTDVSTTVTSAVPVPTQAGPALAAAGTKGKGSGKGKLS